MLYYVFIKIKYFLYENVSNEILFHGENDQLNKHHLLTSLLFRRWSFRAAEYYQRHSMSSKDLICLGFLLRIIIG